MKKTIINFVFLFASFLTMIAQNEIEEKPKLIQELAEINIQSTPWDDGEWWDEEDFAAFLKRYLACIEKPHDRFKRLCAFKLLKQVDWNEQDCILNDTTLWHDLDLFVGRGKKTAYVAAKIDRTLTELGKTALYALLAHPTANVATIQERQAITGFLVEHDDLFQKITMQLQSIAQVEQFMLAFFNQNVLKNASKHCYYQSVLSEANQSSFALQARSIFQHGMRSYATVISGIASVVLGTYGLSQLIFSERGWIDQKADEYKDDAGWVVRRLWPWLTHPLMRGVLAVSGAALCAGACYEEAKWEHACTVLELMLQTITIQIANMMTSLLEISKIVEKNPELAMRADFKPLLDLRAAALQESGQIAEIFELFSSDTLQGKASLLSFQGRTLRAFKLFDEMKESFVPAMVAGAKLDAYMSCARLIRASSNQPVGFCFAQLCNQDTPCIQAEQLWHPFIDPEKVIAHDYELGAKNSVRSMIITGPNEGGKSTVLKEVTLALVMAQSLGIVPAKRFCVTPFATIATYLTLVDDTGSGDSLFRASAIRASQLLDKIESARSGDFVFVAFDELFSGTSPEEGEAAAYSVVKGIAQLPYVISLVATHFPLLTSLAHESNAFASYKIPIHVRPDQTIEYSYKLEPGVSDQHVALHVLRSQGISHRFLDDAIERLTTLKTE